MKYDAFISYRHLEKDMYVAKRVHRALETTKIPRKIQKEIGRKRIDRVFRDQEELPIGSDLGQNIEAALREAAFLVVICSPQTKESYWVMKEIDTFISMHGRENILAVLVDGEPGDSFPPQLLNDEEGNPVEPLAADVRGKNHREINKKLKTESMRLAASILHVDYDDLKQRHRERQMRRNVGIAAGVAAVAIAFGAYTAYNLAKINAEYQEKLINESKVLAAKSAAVLDAGDRQTAALIAMAGLSSEEQERPFVAESMYALSQALDCYDIGANMKAERLLSHVLQVDDFAEKIDGTRVISSDTAGFIYLWDLDTGEELFRIAPEYTDYGFDVTLYDVGFSEEAAVVATENAIVGYDDAGEVLYSYTSDERIKGCTIYQQVNKALLCTDTVFTVLDTNTGEVIKEYENHRDEAFSSSFVMSIRDGINYAAVTRSGYENEINYCTIYNLDTDEYVDVQMTANSMMDGVITADGQLALVVIDYDDLMSLSSVPMYVQKVDTQTGETLWTKEYQYDGSILSTSYTKIRSAYATIDNEQVGRIIVNSAKDVYLLDMTTGEEIRRIAADGYVQRIGFNDEGDIIFIGTSEGKVTMYFTNPNKTLTNNVMDVCDDTLIDFDVQSGRLVARSYRSPELIVEKYITDEDIIYKQKLDDTLSSVVDVSPSGDTYLAYTSIYDSETSTSTYHYDVIVSDTGEVENSFEIGEYVNSKPKYLDDDTIIVAAGRGTLYTYNIPKGDLEDVSINDEISNDVYYTISGEYMLYNSSSSFYVVRLSDMEVVADGTKDEGYYFDEAVLTNDGKTIYYIDRENGANLAKYDINSGKLTVYDEDYRIEKITLNSDSTQIAIACDDVKLRVLDAATMDVVDEIDYYAKSYSGLMEFSADNRYMYLQGADLYFKIYDLENDEFVLEFAKQTNEIDYCKYDESTNRLILSNIVGMSIIDLDSMGELSYIDYGRVYIPQKKMIVCCYNDSLYTFKFKELDELTALADEKYGEKTLTDSQKLRYGIN
ncbi:MAG: TIR domain-containing protein [Pseudobutyrivibrio sp.]|nr:TIR domain-containing protein [Pseudobutyrivibrio sp.]